MTLTPSELRLAYEQLSDHADALRLQARGDYCVRARLQQVAQNDLNRLERLLRKLEEASHATSVPG